MRETSPIAQLPEKILKSLPEFTIRGVILGCIITVFFTASNVYLGLKVGLTFASSIPAAVISMSVLRLFKKSNILENNIVQTVASAAGALAAVIFVLPGLVIIGYWNGFPFWYCFGFCALGGTLGVLFTIPLRRAMVVESDLKYPEGTAAAAILEVGSRDGIPEGEVNAHGGRDLALGAILAAFTSFCQMGFKVIGDEVAYFTNIRGTVVGFGTGLSLALLGAGYLVGINAGLSLLIGSVIGWFGFVSGISYLHPVDPWMNPMDAAFGIFKSQVRFIGVGTMAVGSFWTLIVLFTPMVRGIKSSLEALKKIKAGQKETIPRVDQDMQINHVTYASLVMMVPMYFMFHAFVFTHDVHLSVFMMVLISIFCVLFAYILGFLVASACGYMAGLVGSSNSPISGIAIIAVLISAVLLFLMLKNQLDVRHNHTHSVYAIAIVLFLTSTILAMGSISNDNLQDLKTGQLVGATPYKQQLSLIIGVVIGAMIIPPVLELLYEAYGFAGAALPRSGMLESEALPAPQANLIANIAQGIFNQDLQWGLIGVGACLAVVNIAYNLVIKKYNPDWQIPVIGLAMGIYLPYTLTLILFFGGLLSFFVKKTLKKKAHALGQDVETYEAPFIHRGVLFTSGLIVGESLIGIVIAAVIVFSGKDNPLALVGSDFKSTATWLSVLWFTLVFFLTHRYIVRNKS